MCNQVGTGGEKCREGCVKKSICKNERRSVPEGVEKLLRFEDAEDKVRWRELICCGVCVCGVKLWVSVKGLSVTKLN